MKGGKWLSMVFIHQPIFLFVGEVQWT